MKTQNPFTGRSSGSLANVTASTYLGQNILKSKPLEVRNPQTAKQLNVREIMSLATKSAKLLSSTSSIAKRSARTGRNLNKTARTALNAAILATKSGVAPDIALSFDGINLQGNGIGATVPIFFSVNVTDPLVNVTWPANVPAGGALTDICSVVVLNVTQLKVFAKNNIETRANGPVSENLPSGFVSVGDLCVIFLCFDSVDGTSYDAVSSVVTTAVA